MDRPIDALLESWELSLRARNRAPRTIDGYLKDLRQLVDTIDCEDADDLTTTAIRSYMAGMIERYAPTTAARHYRSIQQFTKWLVAEDELELNPMAGLDPPKVPEQPVPVLQIADLRRLLKTCEGKEFADRRDAAILRLFCDAGVRLEEMAGMTVAGVDLRGQTVTVLGKGRRERSVPFGVKAAQAIDRYLRARARHRYAVDPALWLGAQGKAGLTKDGVYQMVKRRAARVGIDVHPHQFRHTFAHEWLDNGGNEGDLMAIAGWRSRSMLSRYGASAAVARARRAQRENSLGDRL
jgi:site-specific recombinase XerD